MATKVLINGKPYIFNSQVEYIVTLEKILKELTQRKKREFYPKVESKQITIGSEENITKSSNPTRLTATFPKGNYPVSSVKYTKTSAENDMHAAQKVEDNSYDAASEEILTKTKRKTVNYSKLNELESTRSSWWILPPNVLLSKNDLEELKNESLIFVSGSTSSKEETMFFDNMELLSKNNPETLRAAYINGGMLAPEKISKEAMKILKMCAKTVNSGMICYELNNEQLRDTKDNGTLLTSFMAASQLANILANEGYIPFICADADIQKRILGEIAKNQKDYKFICPFFANATSKELTDRMDSIDLVVMHSENPYDKMLPTTNTENYIRSMQNIQNSGVKTSSRA